MKRQLLSFGLIAAPAFALCVAAIALVMIFAMKDDVDTLAKHARAMARTEKSLRAEVETIKSGLAALQTELSPSTVPPVAQAPAASPQPVILTSSHPRAVAGRILRVGAAAPAEFATPPPECVFTPGDPGALTDCIRSQQERLARAPAPAGYR